MDNPPSTARMPSPVPCDLERLLAHEPTGLTQLLAERKRHQTILAYHASRSVRMLVGSSVVAALLAAVACAAQGGMRIALAPVFLVLAINVLLRCHPRRSALGLAQYRLRQLTPVSTGERLAMEAWCAQWPALSKLVAGWKAQGAVLIYRDYQQLLWAIPAFRSNPDLEIPHLAPRPGADVIDLENARQLRRR